MNQIEKILMLPLDDRPCNYLFPQKMLGKNNPEFEMILPDRDKIGWKKIPAQKDYVERFLLENAARAQIAVISIDMLLYGGLLNGRLHHYTKTELVSRLKILEELKRRNPALKIYAFHLIMRCPQYSSSEEEPDYYEECGREIFLLGESLHKQKLGLEVDEAALESYKIKTAGVLGDYLARRAVNVEMNCKTIDYVGSVINFLIIPQDDSSVYGYIAEDQKKVYDYIKECKKQFQVQIYPGADEVGMTLVCRAILEHKGIAPSVYLYYSCVHTPFLVPKYEDRVLGESVGSQVSAAGCRITTDRSKADLILAVNGAAEEMLEADSQERDIIGYRVARNLSLFVKTIAEDVRSGRAVAVADVAYGNGGDLELAALLECAGIAFDVVSYGGWNTSGNTLGTVIAMAALSTVFGKNADADRFLALRYFEDIGFCTHSRHVIAEKLGELACDYRDLGEKNPQISSLIRSETQSYMSGLMPSLTARYEIGGCSMPWNRMFETEFSINERKR